MPRKFLFLLIGVKQPIETWESVLDFTFNLPDVSLFTSGHSLKVGSALALSSKMAFIILMTIFPI